MQTAHRTLSRCLVCGFAEVRTDEVIDRGLVFLAECLHCDHRWPSPEPLSVRPIARRAGARRPREVAPAA